MIVDIDYEEEMTRLTNYLTMERNIPITAIGTLLTAHLASVAHMLGVPQEHAIKNFTIAINGIYNTLDREERR
jgi:hypothetical protein